MNLPKPFEPLSEDRLEFLATFSQSCRHSILQMVTNAQSGHPGGSLGCVDYLSLLYTSLLCQSGDTIVVSNGHISPAVYAVLGEMGYCDKQQAIETFRSVGSPFEGHVTRHVPGVWYGTGPLGTGISAASGFALAEKMQTNGKGTGNAKTVYGLIGDGESQEGQVYEMMNFASTFELDNFIVFMDYNKVQLTDGTDNIMPIDFTASFTAAGWHVIDVDGHDFSALWDALGKAHAHTDKPTLLLGNTIMGKGVDFMEKAGKLFHADWHGKAPTPEQAAPALAALELTVDQTAMIDVFRASITWTPKSPSFPDIGSRVDGVAPGAPIEYAANEKTDCRTAYGKALLDLAKNNAHVVAMTADLAGSVKTSYVKDALPNQHIECGVAEQHMVSCAGGLSLSGMIPFCSTFGAFMTSRAKDQARVNDINQANVKMVATHCGLSVGEDGPTHQAIDDMGSMLGLFHTMVMEPADPNHCDRMIRFAASHYGNCYVRMGRHKIPVLTKEDGSLLFDASYEYHYGRCDVLRGGSDVTLAASGPMVSLALKAVTQVKEQGGPSVELVIMSSPKQFDDRLFDSIKKTGRLITVEDHVTRSGFGSQIGKEILQRNLPVTALKMMGVEGYQLSGTAMELYANAGLSVEDIAQACSDVM
jgi:transketolase